MRIDVAWDSKVHIRHANTNGGWVHSMPGEYARETSKGNHPPRIITASHQESISICHQINNIFFLLIFKSSKQQNTHPH